MDIDKLQAVKDMLLVLIAYATAHFGLNKAQADELLKGLMKTEVPVEEKKAKGYFSLRQLFYPDGHGTEARGKMNLNKISFYVNGKNYERDGVGSNKISAKLGLRMSLSKKAGIKPFMWTEYNNKHGDTSLESITRGGLGIEFNARPTKRLDLKALILGGLGNYKIDDAEGRERTEKLTAGLRALLYLGKGHYLGIFGKTSRIEYNYLGDINSDEVKLKYFFIGEGVSAGVGIGNMNVKYNPGKKFNSPYVEAHVDIHLGKKSNSPRIRVFGRYCQNGEEKLSKSPIPKSEYGLGIIVPFGRKSRENKRRGWNPFLPRGKIGGK